MATEQTYILDGPTDFFFPFPVRTAGQIVVSIEPGGVLPSSSYEVIGASATATGVTIRYADAPRDGLSTLRIQRRTEPLRVSQFLDDLSITARALNAEFDNILQLVQDGVINEFRGAWETERLYLVLDVVVGPDDNIYVSLEQHESDVFATDLSDGKWLLAADFSTGQANIDAALNAAIAARDKAEQWAEEAEDVEVEPGEFSAKHYSIKASDSADAALISEQNAAPVNAIVSEITTVAGIESDVIVVAGINSEVVTVSGIDTEVTTVAGIAADVITTAGNSANITIAATNIGNVNTVAADIANVNAVGTSIVNVNTTAGSIANVNTVATNISNVNIVAGVAADVSTVAGISADVTAVAGNAANINIVSGINSDVTTVAGINADVTTVASLDTEITALGARTVEIDGLFAELSEITTKVGKTSNTGSAIIPTGSEAQRDVTPTAGFFRFNTDTESFEGYNGTAWGSVGGGATGAAGDQVFVENDQVVTASYTITAGKNASTTGPIEINNGVVVTVPDGSRWVIL